MKLLNVMALGRDGIEQLGAEADRLGITFSREAAAKAEMANDAITRLRAVMTGTWQTIAVKLAPWIETLAKRMTELSTSGLGVGNVVSKAFHKVSGFAARLADWFELLKAAFSTLKAGAFGFAEAFVRSIGQVVNVLAKVGETGAGSKILDKLGFSSEGLRAFANEFDATAQGLATSRKKAFGQAMDSFDAFVEGRNAKSVGKFIADVERNADAAAKKIATNAGKFGLGAEGATALAATKPGKFSQIVRSRTALGGGAEGANPQLQSMINLLREINNTLVSGTPAMASAG